MKKLFLLVIILFLLMNLISSPLMFVKEQDGNKGRFYWALTGVVKQGTVIPATPGTNLKAFFRPMENAHLYLLLFDSEDRLTIHFPTTASIYDSCYETFSREISLRVPELPGRSKLYLLISASRLESVEKLLDQYRLLEGVEMGGASVEKASISSKLLTLIRKKSRNLYFSKDEGSSFSDEPVSVDTDIELGIDMVKLISYEDLYVKQYIIEKK